MNITKLYNSVKPVRYNYNFVESQMLLLEEMPSSLDILRIILSFIKYVLTYDIIAYKDELKKCANKINSLYDTNDLTYIINM